MVLGAQRSLYLVKWLRPQKTDRKIFTQPPKKNEAQRKTFLIDQSIQNLVSPPIYLTHWKGGQKKPWRVRSESLLRLESGILRVNLINGIKPCARAAVTELGANFCPIKLAGPIGDTRESIPCGLQLWSRPLK